MNPKLSIVIVNYRSSDALEHCLRSLHVATDASLEIIIVDNSPEEATKRVLTESQFHGHYLPQRSNIGFAAAANVGLEHATGEYVCLLHPDVMLETHSLDRLIEWVEQHPRTVAGPRERNADGDVTTTAFPTMTSRAIASGRTMHSLPWPKRWQPFVTWLVPSYVYTARSRQATEPMSVPVLATDCLVMSRDVWVDVGPFHPELSHFGMEAEWFRRATELGIKAWYVPAAEIFHDAGVSTKRSDAWRVKEGVDHGRRWHARQLGVLALGVLVVALWLERKFEPREH